LSHWRFQIFQHYDDAGEPYLAIHEYYYTHDKQEVWTLKPVPIEADTVSELREALLQILLDLERHGVRDIADGSVVDTMLQKD
jgi:hypothetical protein